MDKDKLLIINDLQVAFTTDAGPVQAVKGISFVLNKGETLGIVGESGSGKSVTALSILGLLPENGNVGAGEILFRNKKGEEVNLLALPEKELRRFRGNEIAMVFQEPMTSLNPVFRCGEQVIEAILLHQQTKKTVAKEQVLSLFEKVKLSDPQRIYHAYPHQLSGGQRQRVVIAMALSCNPSLLIADEPTSSLDVTVQRSILDLTNELKNEWGGSTIFISHDLGVVGEVADRVVVMQQGKIVESGAVAEIFSQPRHDYTKKLLQNFRGQQKIERTSPQQDRKPVLKVSGLQTWFPAKRSLFGKTTGYVKAVDDVTLQVYEGETLGLVGESGSGKTTLGRTILHLQPATGGEVVYDGINLTQVAGNQWATLRKSMQIIFQDPYSSLNPRQAIGPAIAEPMKVHRLYSGEEERKKKTLELLEMVGLEAGHYWRFPSEFSGGQRQRICIARALAVEPKFIVCDECVSALDVTVQAQILKLLKRLQQEKKLTYIFISHDLSVIRQICDRIAVMKDGKIIEIGEAEQVYSQPREAYTKALLDAVPKFF